MRNLKSCEGHSLLASEYQLKLLSTQRSQAAKAGSKKRIFITAPRLVLFFVIFMNHKI